LGTVSFPVVFAYSSFQIPNF